jgi:hypothetical protein
MMPVIRAFMMLYALAAVRGYYMAARSVRDGAALGNDQIRSKPQDHLPPHAEGLDRLGRHLSPPPRHRFVTGR